MKTIAVSGHDFFFPTRFR